MTTINGSLTKSPKILGDQRFCIGRESETFLGGECGGEGEGSFLFGGEGVMGRSCIGGAGGGDERSSGLNTTIFGSLLLALPGLESIAGGEETVGDDGEGDEAVLEDGYDGVLRVDTVEPRFSGRGAAETFSFMSGTRF